MARLCRIVVGSRRWLPAGIVERCGNEGTSRQSVTAHDRSCVTIRGGRHRAEHQREVSWHRAKWSIIENFQKACRRLAVQLRQSRGSCASHVNSCNHQARCPKCVTMVDTVLITINTPLLVTPVRPEGRQGQNQCFVGVALARQPVVPSGS